MRMRIMALLAGRRRFILPILFFIAFFYPTIIYRYEIQNTLTSASRPLWGSPTGPSQVLAHYHANGLWATDDVCILHGFKPRPVVEIIEREMWDAFILDNPTNAELDLLEIRMHETYEVVDRVFIVESNRTINGTPKPFYFGEMRFNERFWQSQHKFVYKAVPAPPIDSIRSPDPEAWEARMRRELNQLIRSRSSNTVKSPIVMFSAVDELPAGHTLRLLRDCIWPSPMHLQMRRFMYSYEWPVGMGSWRAQVHVWDEATAPPLGEGAEDEKRKVENKEDESGGENAANKVEKKAVETGEVRKVKSEYSRDMVSDIVLADAGWHCSYCYRNLEDLSAKLEDDFGEDAASLSLDRIQKAVCEGKDLFNVIPEAYTYKDMFQLLNPEPAKSAVGVPRWIIENAANFKYLLPGGCLRDDSVNAGKEKEEVPL